MTQASKPRLLWFDANRVFAAAGVVLIHSTTDFQGQAFASAEQGERFLPLLLRSISELSSSEMFFMFSLFLMAMRIDKKMPGYGSTISQQATRLLVPFLFWTIFYAFFRLAKADAFGYAPYIWDQISEAKNWVGYLLLGKSQFHMHFLPTLFLLILFYPIMRVATRYPILGLTVVITLGVMQNIQGFFWSLDLDPLMRDLFIRAAKIVGYIGYGMAAFAIYGLWNDGIPRGESRLIRRCGFYFVVLAYVATIPFYYSAYESGSWAFRSGWDFYGHFLMPIFVFFVFMGGQYLHWSDRWSRLSKFTFGVYLVHPIVIDAFDIGIYLTGIHEHMGPAMTVTLRYAFALPASFALSAAIAQVRPMAWIIGLGPNPVRLYNSYKQANPS